MENQYLRWLAEETNSAWWHDSANPDELLRAMENGAVGLTSNPFLIQATLYERPEAWQNVLSACPASLSGDEKAAWLLTETVRELARALRPIYEKTQGRQGFACAQVNPSRQGDEADMIYQARRYAAIAPNVSVKLPATAAGLRAMEVCVAEGMCVTVTASFTVPQALAIGEHYERAAALAQKNGATPRPCFAVLMIGRLDDYLRDTVHDLALPVSEGDIRQAGIAVAKRAYAIFRERNYRPMIMPAGLRGAYHVTELAGANMVFSVAVKIQKLLQEVATPFEQRIDRPVAGDVVERLMQIPDFRKAFEPDGMTEGEFLTYGATQRTLTQFVEAGWSRIIAVSTAGGGA